MRQEVVPVMIDLKKVIAETCAKHVIRLADADQDILVRAIKHASEQVSKDLQRIDRFVEIKAHRD